MSASSGTGGPAATGDIGSPPPPIIIIPPTDGSDGLIPNVSLVECDTLPASSNDAMAPFALTHDAIPPRTLYSWTTAQQIAELRADSTLLTRTVSSTGEVGRAQGLIAELAPTDEIAALLDSERFANKRYAWSNPWATRLGWTGEDYGDRLLAITLKADAWVARMMVDAAGVTWSFSDLSGTALSTEEVLANPDRLAAVYFFDARDAGRCNFEFVTRGSMYREFFVMNEAMIESRSAFTPEIKSELDRGIAALHALADELEANECDALSMCWRNSVPTLWSTGPSDRLVDAYLSALAFPNDLYAPTRTNVAHLIERLEAVPFDEEPL